MYLFNLLPKILPFLECSPLYHQYIPFLDSGNAAATALLSRADQYLKGQMAKLER